LSDISIYGLFVVVCWIAENKGVNEVKLLPSVGRGIKLPPLCDVTLPKAYYDDMSAHLDMSKPGIGRGQQLQGLGGDNSDFEYPGKELLPTNIVPETVSADDFPTLNSATEDVDVISQEEPSSEEPSKKSLKSLAAQFTT